MPRRGFTRVGFVVVLAILGVLLLVLASAVQKVRDAASRSSCLGRHCWMSLGLYNFADQQPNHTLPPGTLPNAVLTPDQRLSWYATLLPYTNDEQLYARIDQSAAWDHPANADTVATPLQWAVCVRRRNESLGPICFTVGVAGVGADAAELPADHPRAGVFGHDRSTALSPLGIADGTSNTLLLIEDGRLPGPWAQGGEATVRGLAPTAGPPGVLHRQATGLFRRPLVTLTAMADGSTRTFTANTSPALLSALATVAGGEPVPTD